MAVTEPTLHQHPKTKTDIDVLASDVGQRIRAARQERGMTLTALAGDDLSRSFLSLVERGHSRISLRALALVADKLQMPISQFLADAPGLAASELALDHAERVLEQQKPAECLKLLDAMTLPSTLRLRERTVRGRALVAEGQATAAVPVLQEALSLAESRKEPHQEAETLALLGGALYTAGTYEEALAYLRRALDLATDGANDPLMVGKVTVYIGHILYIAGDIDGALKHYARARELFGKLGDLHTLACVYSGLSLAYDRKGDTTNALRFSKLSLTAFEANREVRQAARELNNVAMKYRELSDLSQALECARQAVERSALIHATDLEALGRSTLASIYLQLGDEDSARREAGVVDEMEEAHSTPAAVDAWIVLAEIANRHGDHARTDELYRRALDVLERNGWYFARAEKALAYSLLLRERGDTEGALEYAVQAAQAHSSAARKHA
jgi:tetratricopeptide (TPR) repeat protein